MDIAFSWSNIPTINHGCYSEMSGVPFDNGTMTLSLVLATDCAVNQHVVSNACVDCPAGTTKLVGDTTATDTAADTCTGKRHLPRNTLTRLFVL